MNFTKYRKTPFTGKFVLDKLSQAEKTRPITKVLVSKDYKPFLLLKNQ